MFHYQQLAETRIPAALLSQENEEIEIVPPVELGPQLHFQVICNGFSIGEAWLDKVDAVPESGNGVVDLVPSMRFPTYALVIIRVAREYRNRGIGTVLLREILHYCRHNNIARLTGELRGDVPTLSRWLSHHGFSVLNQRWLEIRIG